MTMNNTMNSNKSSSSRHNVERSAVSKVARAVVGLSALAATSVASAASTKSWGMPQSRNRADLGGSCNLGGICAGNPGASIIDVKAARAAAAAAVTAEVDMDGHIIRDVSSSSSSSLPSTATVVRDMARSPLERAVEQLRRRENVHRVIDADGVDVSPQAKAMTWLTRTFDDKQVRHKRMPHVDAVTERYALAVFFYSLGGDEWETSLDFLSTGDVCEWNGMVSTDYYEDDDEADTRFDEDDGDLDDIDEREDAGEVREGENFAALDSKNDDDESFVRAGVFCDSNGSVVSLSIPNYVGMDGSLPAELDLLSNLRTLDLQQQPIEGPIPSEISSLTKLQRLSIQDTALSGAIPTELALLTNLEELELSENHLWGTVPEELGRALAKVTTLQLSRNMLYGPIPESLRYMGGLETFDLSHNQLSGAIPPSLFRFFDSVRLLDFSHNELTGEIPAEIRHLRSDAVNNLVVNLSHNGLIGSIPIEIGEMAGSLEQLFVNNNDLTGEIPAELGELRDTLMTLHVQNNRLSGVVPLDLVNMSWLLYLDVSGNDLVGSLDGVLCNDRDEAEFFAGVYRFAADCGEDGETLPEIICSCCTTCCKDGELCENGFGDADADDDAAAAYDDDDYSADE